MARAMGPTLEGAQKLLGENLNFSLQFLELLFYAPYNHKLRSCINTTRFSYALSWACYASTTKACDKSAIL